MPGRGSKTFIDTIKCEADAKNRGSQAKKKVSKSGVNRALKRAPEEFRLLVDNLNEPGLQLPQAKKIALPFHTRRRLFFGSCRKNFEKSF